MRLFNCWCYLIIKVVCGILKTKEINMGMKLNDFTAIKIYYNDSRVRFDYFCGRKASCGTASLSKSVSELEKEWALRYFIVIIEECIYPRTAQISVICKTGYGTGGAFRTAV